MEKNKMEDKKLIWLAGFSISTILIGFVLLIGINPVIEVVLENGEVIKSSIPISFSLSVTLFLMILSGIACVSLVFYLDLFNKSRKLNYSNSLKLDLLSGDEKKVFKYLLDNGDSIQKDLVFELEISKVKLSRILDSMSSKNVIERISYGNTNKIKLK